MKDIAKLAKVSYATVSNVLNQRGNVSTEKIHLVEDAARRLGYNFNAQAQKLRKETNRHLAFILPDLAQRIYYLFYSSLKTLVEEIDYDTSLYLSYNSPDKELSCVRAALSNRPEYIILLSCLENSAEYSNINSKMIFINNPSLEPGKNQISFSFDFYQTGSEVAEEIARRNISRAAFFFDSPGIPANRIFFDTISKKLSGQQIEMIQFAYDPHQIYHGAISILKRSPPFDLVVSNNPLYLDKLRRMRELLGTDLPEMISFGASETIPPFSYPRYQFDYRRLAYLVYLSIRDDSKYLGKSLAVKPAGFADSRAPVPAPKPARELRLLTVVSPTAEILSGLAYFLRQCTGISLKIISLPYEEIFSMLSGSRAAGLDLIRIDMARSLRFDQEYYLPLNTIQDRILPLTESFLPSIRSVYCPDINKLYALPFDTSVQMLFYRRDLFENATLQRLYYEKTKKRLRVPRTFDEYHRIAAFFTFDINPASPVKFGATMTYGTASVAATDILYRIKSMGGEIFNAEGELCLVNAAFEKALNEYLEMRKYSNTSLQYWWDDALNSFIQGQSAMTNIFTNYASRIIRTNNGGFPVKIGSAPVPGNSPLLAGGCIGISRQSRNIEACLDFFEWVYSNKTANMITLLGGLSPCRSVYENEEILELYPWLRNIGEQFHRGWRRISSQRYPYFDNHRFESIFGNAVRNAALGVVSPREALENAQQECEQEFERF